jgi:glycosyltransferase involved in cell wall biosynthesis
MVDYSDINIEWQSEITSKVSGYGLQARRMLKPLLDGGAKIKLIPDEDYVPDHMRIVDPFWNSQVEASRTMEAAPIRIMYCLPPRYKPEPNKINVGYTMWETNKYPRPWVHHINNTCNVFFAGCNSLVKSAQNGGVKCPIIPMNATIDINEWLPTGDKLNVNEIPETDVKFLFIGNFIPRKNLEQLLLGFAAAFEGVTDASLIIKTWSNLNNAQGKKHISDAIRHLLNKATGLDTKPKVAVISDVMEEFQIMSLIRSCDVYTSVSKGEGFDLPVMQAMAMEKMIVTTRFLAHGDYLTDDNSIDVPYTLTPCTDAAAPLYDAYQLWSSPNMEKYIESLRLAYTAIKSGTHKHLGVNARKTIEEKFSVDVNTEYLANTIRDISKGKYAPASQSFKEHLKQLAQ